MNKIKKNAVAKSKLNWKIMLIYPLFVVLFIFLINIAIAPLYKMQEFKHLVISDSLFLEKYDSIYDYPDMSLLLKEKAYKEALLELAESDSIQMVINLSDSTVNLFIKGVLIHQVQVKTFEMDRLFKVMPLIQQVKLFSQPLPVDSQYATIVKEPIVVHHAPKDAFEAATNAWQPDTLIQDPAFLIFSVEHGINLIFEQDNNFTFHDKWEKFIFYSKIWLRSLKQSVSNFLNFKRQKYYPAITIKMPVDDLRVIYRALPENTFVVLTF